MGRPCSICHHPHRTKITTLRDEGATLQALAPEFRVTVSALSRHFASPKCTALWQAVECPQEPLQAVPVSEATELRRVAGGRPIAFSGPAIRTREAVKPADLPCDPVTPVSLALQAPCSGKVVTFPRGVATEVLERSVQIPSIQAISRMFDLGYDDEAIRQQFNLSEEQMSGYQVDVAASRRAVATSPPVELIAGTLCSCLIRMARYRRKIEAAEAGLRHREALAYEALLATAEGQFAKYIKDFGYVGRLDPAELERETNGADDIYQAVSNSIRGIFVEPEPVRDVKPLIRA